MKEHLLHNCLRSSIFIYLILFTFSKGNTQDKFIDIPTPLYEENGFMELRNSTAWYFKEDSDINSIIHSFDTTEWENINPRALISRKTKEREVDFEGWFRIKVMPKDNIVNQALIFFINNPFLSTFEIYLDEELIYSTVEEQSENQSWRNNNSFTSIIKSSIVFTSTDPSILSFFVRKELPKYPYSTLFPSRRIDFGAEIVNEDFIAETIEVSRWTYILSIGAVTLCSTLSLLFWLLFILNKEQKNLILIALFSTWFALVSISFLQLNFGSLTWSTRILYYVLGNFSGSMIGLFIILITSKILSNKLPKKLIFYLLVATILFVALVKEYSLLSGVLLLFLLGVSFRIIFLERKVITGAQRIIIVGLMGTIIIGIFSFLSPFENNLIEALFFFGILVFFPVCLLIYVSIRFREMITEVRIKGEKVLQVSEEKNKLIENQKGLLEEEVKKRTSELNQSLEDLKSTQAQLIHAEKMASLGELTAGIAHEIQNPLNFVNNFSEVSGELIDEAVEEIDSGELGEAKEILEDLKENLGKITHHGHRASGIVKSMLDHSRASGGEKVETDINVLCDEYLRLAYHGMRAKDRSFNAELVTDFDESLPKIKVVPQDIGRVLLNLINNAFQAVNEESLQGLEALKGKVCVTTKNLGNSIEITVSDNGPGIPDDIKDKIFQPFFTTKPTGEGTGLGLSLSYDIIKAHGGTIEVSENKPRGTVFSFSLKI